MTSPASPADLSAWGAPRQPRGAALLTDPLLNKGTAFTERERDALGLRGLLPPRVFTLEEQAQRSLASVGRKPDALEKYIYLANLQNRNEILFYRLVMDNIEEMVPLIYTPTVGQACLEYGAIYRRPRGLFLTLRDRGRIAEVLHHWPLQGVRLIVVTDGERILGLGDLGALGMGIPVGKLSLYTACAGVHPSYTLPITLDVGSDNQELLDGPVYIGLRQKRARGAEYDAFIEEFVTAVRTVFPKALLQWEDFGNTNAFRLLGRYRKQLPSFNDDIQGTAAVALAGVMATLRVTGGTLAQQRLLFLGAGEAGTGIADLYVAAAMSEGLSETEARARCWFVDSKGLVVKARDGELADHKRPYAHEHPFIATLGEAVRTLKPTALIGVSGMPQTFTQPIVEQMAGLNQRPVVFALSNPTSKAECTAEQAYAWSDGRAIFASGSPFPEVSFKGRRHVPGQGNNIYIFPGVGLGALASESREVTDAMFLAAARTLAAMVDPADLELGRVYPALTKIRDVSLRIAAAVAAEAHDLGLAQAARPDDLVADIRARMFEPVYREYA
ncbi:putative NAD-dependent malic enzyme 2 [Luteitalea pratensis]|uniref:Malolactic enzyme n=1 Tax=Luteitalea pratensis TaxID=1855912 RepID=A0A143PK34_LUTPR|nr:NAD-dependent malic enzyme [Luteitalea pratensis]AMY08851.1 putative NAD-dependent malic enzyme 2 [Luteitalea pratensis]